MADDYFAAMQRVEQRLALGPAETEADPSSRNDEERVQVLAMIDQLAVPGLSIAARLDLVEDMRHLLAPEEIIERATTTS